MKKNPIGQLALICALVGLLTIYEFGAVLIIVMAVVFYFMCVYQKGGPITPPYAEFKRNYEKRRLKNKGRR